MRLAQGGKLSLGDDVQPAPPDVPGMQSLAARDFRYDRTQLPRYGDAVQTVASSLSYRSSQGPDRPSGSGAGIITTSPFDTVVDWYRTHLPPGWHVTSIGDFGQLAQFAQQIQGNLLGATQGTVNGGSGSATTGGAAPGANVPSAPQDKIRIAMCAPVERSQPERSIMIVEKGDGPVQVLMQAKFVP